MAKQNKEGFKNIKYLTRRLGENVIARLHTRKKSQKSIVQPESPHRGSGKVQGKAA